MSDFADHNALSLVRSHDNVTVLRSLSKSFSLAGMRLGLCFAQPPVIENLNKVKDSYNLSRVAQAAGAAALEDAAWAMRNVERVRATRSTTETALRAIGLECGTRQPQILSWPAAGSGPVGTGRDPAPARNTGALLRHAAAL